MFSVYKFVYVIFYQIKLCSNPCGNNIMFVKRKMSEANEDDVYGVEKIVGKRITGNQVEYNVKWENYPESANTWELESRIFCKDLIEIYEKTLAQKKNILKEDDESEEFQIIPFPEYFEAEKIIGMSNISNTTAFLMQWKNLDRLDFVAAIEARYKCPEIVLDYYESIIEWNRNN